METSNTQSHVAAVIVQNRNGSIDAILPKGKKQQVIILGVTIASIILALFYYFIVYRFIESTNDAYVKADLAWISPKIEGKVVDILVKNNQSVKKNQVLMKIEDNEILVKEQIAEANLRSSRASQLMQKHEITEAKSEISQSKALVSAAEAEYQKMKLELGRYTYLLQEGITSRQNFESISSQYGVAKANLEAARGEAHAKEARLAKVISASKQVEAGIDAAEANTKLLEIDKNSTSIVAPISGIVGNFNLEVGSRVFPQSRLLAIVSQDSAYIAANFKETQIHRMKIGQIVEVQLDAYPGQVFQGYIESFSPAAGIEFSIIPVDNSVGNYNKIVQRVQAKIKLDNIDPSILLRPGLSAIVRVDTRH